MYTFINGQRWLTVLFLQILHSTGVNYYFKMVLWIILLCEFYPIINDQFIRRHNNNEIGSPVVYRWLTVVNRSKQVIATTNTYRRKFPQVTHFFTVA